MLLVKFTKTYPASFMSHLDILRSMLRAFVRAGIKVRRSENAFNPHYKVYFTPPLPLTVESIAEYMCVDTDCEPKEFMERFNEETISGIKVLSVSYCEVNPNVAGIVTYSDYEVSVCLNDKQKEILSRALSGSELIIKYMQKDKLVEKDVRSKILSFNILEDKLLLTLASGSDNLRVDRLLGGIEGLDLEYDIFDVLRLEQYTGDKDSLQPLCKIGEVYEE